MEIRLRTDKFCIETAAQRTYEKLLKQYFKSNADDKTRPGLEDQIEGLKTFLEQVDAKFLRSSYPELDKGGETDVVLKVESKSRKITLVFKGQEISSPQKFLSAKGTTGSSLDP